MSGPAPSEPADGIPHESETCSVCPICVGLRVLSGSSPEVAVHLRAAAREIAAALGAALEVGRCPPGEHRSAADAPRAGQDGPAPRPGGLRRIPVE